MSSNPIEIRFGDTANLTAFSRLRVSEARCIGDYRYMYSQGTSALVNDFTSTGGTITSDFTRNCVLLATTGSVNSRAVRQTKKYHPYISGTSNVAYATFVMNQPIDGLQQMVGLFDDLNGIFFRMNGTTPEFVVRKGGTDVSVVPRINWNEDKLLHLDFSKAQILFIDYQWLGVGRIRVGFVDGGIPVICHEFYHNNQITEVYMQQPSLPVRYEIKNTSTTGSTSTLMAICSAVYCEGSANPISYNKAVSSGATAVPTTATGNIVLAVRLRNALVGKHNRAIVKLAGYSLFTSSDCLYKILILPNSSVLANTPTWTAVPGYSWSEYTTNVPLASNWAANNDFHVLADSFASGSGGGYGTTPIQTINDNENNAIYQNYDSTDSQILAVVGITGSGGNPSNLRASLSWTEFK